MSGEILLVSVSILIGLKIVFLTWYLLFNDRDCALALYERFGHGVSLFSGKVVWLTGATTGLGEEIAHQLASAGAKLILSGRNTEELERIKAECVERSNGKLSNDDVLIQAFDITRTERKYLDTAIRQFEKIDVLVTNIGHVQLGESCAVDIDTEKALFDVNFFGCVCLVKLVVRHFLHNDGGQIIVISSMAGKTGNPGLASYAASKHALLGYFDSLRLEYWRSKISVTVVCPSFFQSAIADQTFLVGNAKITMEEQAKIKRKSMNVSRCAHLTLVAAANRLYEAWISYQPFLALMALAQYCPDIHKCIMKCLLTNTRLEKIYNGKWPNILSWKPLTVI